MGRLLGGPKGMLAPPLKLLGGGGPGPPWPPLFLRLWNSKLICILTLHKLYTVNMKMKDPVKNVSDSTEVGGKTKCVPYFFGYKTEFFPYKTTPKI